VNLHSGVFSSLQQSTGWAIVCLSECILLLLLLLLSACRWSCAGAAGCEECDSVSQAGRDVACSTAGKSRACGAAVYSRCICCSHSFSTNHLALFPYVCSSSCASKPPLHLIPERRASLYMLHPCLSKTVLLLYALLLLQVCRSQAVLQRCSTAQSGPEWDRCRT
jgi:hypothetical protein